MLTELKVIYQRETELRKIYKANNRRDRQKFSPLRSLMAEQGIDYEQLQVSNEKNFAQDFYIQSNFKIFLLSVLEKKMFQVWFFRIKTK